MILHVSIIQFAVPTSLPGVSKRSLKVFHSANSDVAPTTTTYPTIEPARKNVFFEGLIRMGCDFTYVSARGMQLKYICLFLVKGRSDGGGTISRLFECLSVTNDVVLAWVCHASKV